MGNLLERACMEGWNGWMDKTELCLPPAYMLVSCSDYSLTLKMETCYSKTSVDFQQTTWRYIPENRALHNHHCENLKSYTFWILQASLQEICRHGLDPPAQHIYTGPLYFLDGVRTWSLTKSHLECNYFKWSLKDLLTRMCSYKVIHPGITTRSAFIAWITDLTFGIKWPLNASSICYVFSSHCLVTDPNNVLCLCLYQLAIVSQLIQLSTLN
jgi:hypothetical protein